MPRLDDFFESKYLKAGDLDGREVKVIIDRVETVSFERDGKDERKLALFFQGKKKAMLLNKTNATRIAAAHGQETDNWRGKEIFLYPDQTNFQGQVVDCLRVRALRQREPGEEAPIDW